MVRTRRAPLRGRAARSSSGPRGSAVAARTSAWRRGRDGRGRTELWGHVCILDEGRGVSPPKHRARPMSEAGGAEYYVRARARAARAPRLQPRDTGAPVHALLMGAGGLCVYCELCVERGACAHDVGASLCVTLRRANRRDERGARGRRARTSTPGVPPPPVVPRRSLLQAWSLALSAVRHRVQWNCCCSSECTRRSVMASRCDRSRMAIEDGAGRGARRARCTSRSRWRFSPGAALCVGPSAGGARLRGLTAEGGARPIERSTATSLACERRDGLESPARRSMGTTIDIRRHSRLGTVTDINPPAAACSADM